MNEDGEERKDIACEHGGRHKEGRQESITEVAVEQKPHSDLLGEYITLQDSRDNAIRHLFLEPTSKDVEKRAWKAFWGPILEEPRLVHTIPHGIAEIQCFAIMRKVPRVAPDDPPSFRTEHRHRRDRLYYELADMKNAIEEQQRLPTAKEEVEMTRLKQMMDALASGTAQGEPLKTDADPTPSSTHPSLQSSTATNTQSSTVESAQTGTALNTGVNSSLNTPNGEEPNKQKGWSLLRLLNFRKDKSS